ncbi:MAG: hypothetical protein KGS61_20525, partial [Verrucomicrobia bacterium]|nr:hypothetical protein [Verrucomicrobiota bacterium]
QTNAAFGAGGFGGGAAFGGGGGFGAGGLPGNRGERAVFFNDRTGLLFVRAAQWELDVIDQALQALNTAPPQVQLEAKFTQISQTDAKALGFDWFLGNFLMNGGAMGLQAGTAPSFQGPGTAANPIGAFPGNPTPTVNNPSGTAISPSATDQLLTGGLRQQGINQLSANAPNVPTIATFTGILTDPQFRMVIDALEQRSGVDLLSAPKVTTLSGRQAQVLINQVKTIVAGLNLGFGGGVGGAGFGGGIGGAAGGAAGGLGFGAIQGVSSPAANYLTLPVPLGPTLDVIPYVSADGYSIQMTIIPTIVDFLGYDNPGAFIPQAQGAAGNTLGTPLIAQLPLPKFQVRQVTTSAIVWDGQTVVLGGLISENLIRTKDKVPFLGDIPLLGRLFRSESSYSEKENLIIFITPTIIDPAGNRVHTEDNMPYDPNKLPAGAMPAMGAGKSGDASTSDPGKNPA